jgi:ABC-2 type transport system ATP-binding protein
MALALSINNLEKTYATGTKALKGVSFDVAEGELFALLGANGAGKTTLIGILTGLVKKTDGSATVFGIDLDKEPEKVRSMIGVVPQEFNFSIFEKVLDIVVDAAGYYGIPRSEAVPRAEQILKDLGLFEKRNAVSRTLSGGMKRRLLIARALVHQPKLLLLDEPSAGVDVELRREMWEFVQKLNAAGTTIILTTHYLEEAERLCKNVVLIKEGIVAEHGDIKELMTKTGAHTLEDFYLHVNKRV